MALPSERRRSYLGRQLATMALSQVAIDQPMAPVRAAAWSNALARVGLVVPLFVVHDLGVILTWPRGPQALPLRAREAALARLKLPPQGRAALERYRRLLADIAGSEVVERLSGMRVRDELMAAVLMRLLGDVYNRWRERGKGAGAEALPLDPSLYDAIDVGELASEFDLSLTWGFLDQLVAHAEHVYTSVELLDLDTLRLLGMFRDDAGGTGTGGGLEIVDLMAALGSVEAHDVANFSLELLPSVLETRRASGVQAFAVDGYASIERTGNIDSLVLSELAYDREIFEQKAVDQELLYYGREREREDERRLQYILIDSSASMRGQRQVFARGLALTLAKRFALEGDEVCLRFFDSRLHETVRLSRGGALAVPQLLAFRSERGRNYGKVFTQLVTELGRIKRDRGGRIVLYIITHGQCHLAADTVAALRALAYTYAIIVLPSEATLPEFVAQVDRRQIVELADLASRKARQQRALDIVSDSAAASTKVGGATSP